MSNLRIVREALAATLTEQTGLTVHGRLGSAPAPLPGGLLKLDKADYMGSFRGSSTKVEYSFHLWVIVGMATEWAQDALDEYISAEGPSSVRRALFQCADLGLGSSVQAIVDGVIDYGGQLELVGIDHLAAQLQITVHAQEAKE